MSDTPAASPDASVILAARNVSKSYGAIQAIKHADFDIRRGEVTTLFGENGAGKSTLMKILSGVVAPTSGEIILDGKPVRFANSTEARDRGISIIHQELSLAPNLSVRDNIFMGREIRGATGVDFAEEARQTRALMLELEEDIDPLTPVEELRLGQQQIVEIARALSVNSRILIMDEPTSALSATEVEVLFKVIHDLTSRGVSIVYISHHLEEALQITNHAVVLRDGAMTAYAPRKDIDLEWIVRNMVGDNFDLGAPPTGYAIGEVALSIENLSVPAPGGAYSVVDRLSLDVRAGEVVCIYGLMGAGRTEMMECVAGRLQALRRPRAPARQGRLPPQHRPAHRRRAGAGPRGPPARRPRPDHVGRPESLARQPRRLHPRPLHLAQTRKRPDRPLDPRRPHQDRRRRRR